MKVIIQLLKIWFWICVVLIATDLFMALLVWVFFDFERSMTYIRNETSATFFYIVVVTILTRVIGSFLFKVDNLQNAKSDILQD